MNSRSNPVTASLQQKDAERQRLQLAAVARYVPLLAPSPTVDNWHSPASLHRPMTHGRDTSQARPGMWSANSLEAWLVRSLT